MRMFHCVPTRPALKEGSLGVARRTSGTGEEEPATLILAINAWRNKGYSTLEFMRNYLVVDNI